MLYLLVHNAPRIIKPYLDAIVDALMSKLKETDQNTAVMTAVLEALGGVCEVSKGIYPTGQKCTQNLILATRFRMIKFTKLKYALCES